MSEFAWDRRLEPSARQSRVTQAQFLAQACVGVASQIEDPTDAQKLDALLNAFGTRFMILNGDEVEHAITMASLLLNTQSDFRMASLESERFWLGIFSIPCRVLRGQMTGYLGEATEKRYMINPFTAMAMTLEKSPADAHLLVRSCVRGKFFDILDEVVQGMLDFERAGAAESHDRPSGEGSCVACVLVSLISLRAQRFWREYSRRYFYSQRLVATRPKHC